MDSFIVPKSPVTSKSDDGAAQVLEDELVDTHLSPIHQTISNVPSLVCAFAAAATTGGTSYAFGFYSAALKQNLHLTQNELNSISTAFFVAGLFSWIPGLFSDRFGTKFALSLGGCTGAASLLLYWAVARVMIAVPRELLVLVLSSLGVVTFLSCASVTGAVFKIIVAAAGPGIKGSAVGVAKGYVGLGAGLYSCLFQAFRSRGESDLDFLPMAAFFFLTNATIPALILLPSKRTLEATAYQDECTGRHIHTLYWSLISMAVVIVGSSMINLYSPSPSSTQSLDVVGFNVSDGGDESTDTNYGMGLLLAVIWLGPISVLSYLPRKISHTYSDGAVAIPNHDIDEVRGNESLEEDKIVRRRKSGGRQDDRSWDKIATAPPSTELSPKPKSFVLPVEEKRGLLVEPLDKSSRNESSENSCDSGGVFEEDAIRNMSDVEQSKNMLQMLGTPTAWLLLWTTTILVGAGTVETNNMGQMVESLGFEPRVTSASLAFFSVSQAAARVFMGSLSESALTWNTRMCCIDSGVPRPFFLIVASLVGFIAHLTLGFAKIESLFVIGSALAGTAFGMVWPLMVLITAEVFGVEGAGQNYMFYDGVSSAVGTLLVTKVIAQEVYDDNTNPDGPDARTCIGMACFQATHLIVAGLSLTCVLSSVALLFTSRQVYNLSRSMRVE